MPTIALDLDALEQELAEEHLKAESRGATWCGLRYDVQTSRDTPQSGKPVCQKCQQIENGEAPSKAPRPMSDLFR